MPLRLIVAGVLGCLMLVGCGGGSGRPVASGRHQAAANTPCASGTLPVEVTHAPSRDASRASSFCARPTRASAEMRELLGLSMDCQTHTRVIACRPGTPSAANRLDEVCAEASHELLVIDQHKLVSSELSDLGKFIEEAAREGQHVDEATASRVRILPSSRFKSLALTNLASSRSELAAIVDVVRRHGIAFDDLPRGLLKAFVQANHGCAAVKLTKPIA